jgi:histidine ammonia-lyase
VGRPLETPVIRAMMLIRANTLAKGHSGCRQVVIDLLLRMLGDV